ncbi:MAG: SRPBCC domain-containing protein [Acidimicrobiia bacterium]
MVQLARHEVVIQAPASEVFSQLTTVDGLLSWIAVDATADAVPGGELSWTHENGATMQGRFIQLDPPRRLVIAYGWKDDLMGVPPESTTVSIELTEEAGVTTLKLVHSSLPPDSIPDHNQGWVFFLDKLRVSLAAIERPNDPLEPVIPTR